MLSTVTLFLLLLSRVNCSEFNMFNRYLSENSPSNTECQLQKDLFLKSLENRTEWALTMLDASGRLPQAITQGNVYDLGMYDQCLNIYEEISNVTIKGKYCARGLAIPLTYLMKLEANETTNSTTTLFISVCIPDACLPSDFFGKYSINEYCKTKNQNKFLDGDVIAFLVFMFAILLAMAASTAYDYYIQKHSKEPHHAILLVFSVYTNAKKITGISQQSDQILVFNGMKVISMFWVILGHRFGTNTYVALNRAEFAKWKTSWYAAYYAIFGLSVDTFFFVSAALMSSSVLKSYGNSKRSFNILLYYVRRYFRLTPALAALYFFQVTAVRKLVSSPHFLENDVTEMFKASCTKHWWSFFLYIQNYLSTGRKMCLEHTWYVDVDMQFILISPLVLIPLLRYPKQMTYIALPILIFVTTIHPMLITYFFDLKLYSTDFWQKYYQTAHMRLSEWLVGIMFGAFLVDYRKNIFKYRIKSKVLHLLVWLLVFIILAVQPFLEIKIRQNPTVLNTMLYYPLQRTIWPLCLCWISYACLNGYAGLINWFLSLPVFQVLSKLIYSIYLVHPIIIIAHVGNFRTLPYFSDYEQIRATITDIVLALPFGLFWALAFEYPGINIEQVLFGQKRNKKQCQKDHELQ